MEALVERLEGQVGGGCWRGFRGREAVEVPVGGNALRRGQWVAVGRQGRVVAARAATQRRGQLQWVGGRVWRQGQWVAVGQQGRVVVVVRQGR